MSAEEQLYRHARLAALDEVKRRIANAKTPAIVPEFGAGAHDGFQIAIALALTIVQELEDSTS